jgi:hypothetical protein
VYELAGAKRKEQKQKKQKKSMVNQEGVVVASKSEKCAVV